MLKFNAILWPRYKYSDGPRGKEKSFFAGIKWGATQEIASATGKASRDLLKSAQRH